jgi:hypothetical protein
MMAVRWPDGAMDCLAHVVRTGFLVQPWIIEDAIASLSVFLLLSPIKRNLNMLPPQPV